MTLMIIKKIIFFLFLFVLLAELFLRFVDPYLGNNGYWNDPHVGLRIRPYISNSNSYGFNDMETPLEKDPSIPRILALGDSFNWVGGINHNYWTLVEKKLNEENYQQAEILNQGTPMIGPAYLLRLLQNVGIKFSPDIVILAFLVENDFEDSDLKRFRIMRLGYLLDLDIDSRLPQMKSYLSYLYFFKDRLKIIFTDWLFKTWENRNEENLGTFSRKSYTRLSIHNSQVCKQSFYLNREWLNTKKVISKFKNYLDKRHIQFHVVLLPSEFQVDPKLQEAIVLHSSLTDSDKYDWELPQRRLKAFFDENSISYVDLLPAFRVAARTGSLYKIRDTHFNLEGNKLAAKIISSYLRQQMND